MKALKIVVACLVCACLLLASSISPGVGTVTSVTVAGTAGQITATGTCTVTSTGTCTLSLPATITEALTFSAGISSAGVTDSNLTATQVVYAGSGGVLTGSSNLIYSGVTLQIIGSGYTYISPGLIDLINNSGSNSKYLEFSSLGAVAYGWLGATTGSGTTGAPQYLDIQIAAAGTLRVINSTATTGATRMEVALGAADSASTNILTVDGSQTINGTLTYNGNSPPTNSVVCYKAGGVMGYATNTAGVIGTTCN